MDFTIISLPNPLILLIHLHILEYPNANNPEYDLNIFNSRVRGLRERVKLMEDISYFLVGRVEGGKSGAKTVSKKRYSDYLINWQIASSNISLCSPVRNRGISDISR